jgi:hypothetical protein
VNRLTLELANLPPGTAVPMTQLAWAVGWDVLMRHDGDPPPQPQFQRPMLLGHYIQFLIAITQFWCPICQHRLLTDHDLRDMPAIYEAPRLPPQIAELSASVGVSARCRVIECESVIESVACLSIKHCQMIN